MLNDDIYMVCEPLIYLFQSSIPFICLRVISYGVMFVVNSLLLLLLFLKISFLTAVLVNQLFTVINYIGRDVVVLYETLCAGAWLLLLCMS